MRFLRRPVREPQEPTARLWHELEPWFRDEGNSFPGPDVSFSGLKPAELELGWQYLAAKADPIDPSKTVWDGVEDREVSTVEALQDGAVAAAARCPNFLVGLSNIEVAGVRLPWLGVSVYPDELAPYWWVSDDSGWDAETVGGLAVLLGDLRSLLPSASISLEWPGGEDFWIAVDAYLSAVGSA